jgi:hypothetical protein
MYRSGGMPNELQPQGACELQGRWIEAPGLPALMLPVDADRWVLADNRQFLGLDHKTKWAMVCQLRHKIDREDEDGVGHALRSSGLLWLKASQASVSQSSLKTSGGTTRMVHVESSWRSRGDEVKDGQVNATGCIALFYPNFTISCCIEP